MIYEPIPLKCCSKCREWFPGTTEYFLMEHRNKDGLYSWCRECKRAAKRNYDDSHRERCHETSQRYHRLHREAIRERKRQNRQANLDKTRKNERRIYNANRERECEKYKRYRLSHPENVRISWKRRRDRKQRLTSSFTQADREFAWKFFQGVCAYCGNPPSLFDAKTVLHEEHFVPVVRSGGYTPSNILPACQSCNQSKGDRDAIEWLNRRFGKRKAEIILKRIQGYFNALRQHSG